MRKTLAFDQGKEIARYQDHQELARRLSIRVYFADPQSPWQRPSNENTNSLRRHYLETALTNTESGRRRPRKPQSWRGPGPRAMN